jgi:phosphomannomutase
MLHQCGRVFGVYGGGRGAEGRRNGVRGGDLRDSTPRITQAVAKAVADGGYKLVVLRADPTPALALRSMGAGAPGIMVTGSHIPADRNGIKFYKRHDEVLKADEGPLRRPWPGCGAHMYGEEAEASAFDEQGALKEAPGVARG